MYGVFVCMCMYIFGNGYHSNPGQLAPWLEQGQAKVVVRVESLAEMQTVATNARAAGIPTYIVRDAGRTQVQVLSSRSSSGTYVWICMCMYVV